MKHRFIFCRGQVEVRRPPPAFTLSQDRPSPPWGKRAAPIFAWGTGGIWARQGHCRQRSPWARMGPHRLEERGPSHLCLEDRWNLGRTRALPPAFTLGQDGPSPPWGKGAVPSLPGRQVEFGPDKGIAASVHPGPGWAPPPPLERCPAEQNVIYWTKL